MPELLTASVWPLRTRVGWWHGLSSVARACGAWVTTYVVWRLALRHAAGGYSMWRAWVACFVNV